MFTTVYLIPNKMKRKQIEFNTYLILAKNFENECKISAIRQQRASLSLNSVKRQMWTSEESLS